MTGSGCMDFSFDRMNRQTPSHEDDQSIDFNNLEQLDFARGILVTAPKLQEDWLGTKVISISLCLLSL